MSKLFLTIVIVLFLVPLEGTSQEDNVSDRLERVIAKIPNVDLSRATFTKIAAGETNHNFSVDIENEKFFVSLGGDNASLLDINRKHAYIANKLAHKALAAPKVILYAPEEDALVTSFIQGAHLQDLASQPPVLSRVVQAIRSYHLLSDPFPSTVCPFKKIQAYDISLQEQGIRLPSELRNTIITAMKKIQIAVTPHQKILPCHLDLHTGNFIDDGEKIWVVDWEYAGMSDVFFDLATFASTENFSDEAMELLAKMYFGEVNNNALAHLGLMRMVADVRWYFWCLIQHANCGSEQHVDYKTEAQCYLNQFLKRVHHPNFEKWLQELSEPTH